jgi:hypothetical protein
LDNLMGIRFPFTGAFADAPNRKLGNDRYGMCQDKSTQFRSALSAERSSERNFR